MQIDDQCVRDFQDLYRECYGIELSAAEARKEATDLVFLLRMFLEFDE